MDDMIVAVDDKDEIEDMKNFSVEFGIKDLGEQVLS